MIGSCFTFTIALVLLSILNTHEFHDLKFFLIVNDLVICNGLIDTLKSIYFVRLDGWIAV